MINWMIFFSTYIFICEFSIMTIQKFSIYHQQTKARSQQLQQLAHPNRNDRDAASGTSRSSTWSKPRPSWPRIVSVLRLNIDRNAIFAPEPFNIWKGAEQCPCINMAAAACPPGPTINPSGRAGWIKDSITCPIGKEEEGQEPSGAGLEGDVRGYCCVPEQEQCADKYAPPGCFCTGPIQFISLRTRAEVEQVRERSL